MRTQSEGILWKICWYNFFNMFRWEQDSAGFVTIPSILFQYTTPPPIRHDYSILPITFIKCVQVVACLELCIENHRQTFKTFRTTTLPPPTPPYNYYYYKWSTSSNESCGIRKDGSHLHAGNLLPTNSIRRLTPVYHLLARWHFNILWITFIFYHLPAPATFPTPFPHISK